MVACRIDIDGIVQGVGFRPFVARLARSLGLAGWVRNSPRGVEVMAQASGADLLCEFERRLQAEAPSAARIVALSSVPCEPQPQLVGFTIEPSEHDGLASTLVSPDLATCPECLAELFDPENRRFHYPFINCTNCGPRFTIINELPYDRPATSMRAFEMCPACAAEYACESDRRYHAQPDACFACGPALWLAVGGHARVAGNREESDALIAETAERLGAGEVVAVKGLGGWHLACDARNEAAVAALRERKHRPTKPLALMVRNLERARELVELSPEAEQLLEGSVRPIVLGVRTPVSFGVVARSVAGCLPELGVMLPATPVQHLLLAAFDHPLIMTSGNRSGEPIVAGDDEAFDVLGGIADAFLGNSRAIVARYDDSVVRVLEGGQVQMVRRARGYAPAPLFVRLVEDPSTSCVLCTPSAQNDVGQCECRSPSFRHPERRREAPKSKDLSIRDAQPPAAPAGEKVLPLSGGAGTPNGVTERVNPPVVFAVGPEQKATFCMFSDGRAYVSQHLGDLECLGAWQAWDEARRRYERLFDLTPQVLACDLHPEYLASKWVREQAAHRGLPLVEVQHHHAHIASVLGENALFEPVLGVALDGTGYGTDGTIWGCELLLATREGFERLWHLPQFKLPGGAAAIKEPARTAYALLVAASQLTEAERAEAGWQGLTLDNPQFAPFLVALENRAILDAMLSKNLNSPACSSLGRAFDAVAALLGLCARAGYDGEPACLLEAAAYREGDGQRPQGGNVSALGFHRNIAGAIIEQCVRAREESGINKVALSGGCMANRLLSGLLREGLHAQGFQIYENRELPPNDGCISYGQAIVAAARLQRGECDVPGYSGADQDHR